ncbi:MAG: hypothetical protein IJ840_05210, partial [Bacteroidales bacterium]|nr:hypothetical protein [Bacteroidales bacterium]
WALGSFSIPTFMVSRSFTFTSFIFSSIFSGRRSGKNEMSLSSPVSFPSEIAKPIAVAVNV